MLYCQVDATPDREETLRPQLRVNANLPTEVQKQVMEFLLKSADIFALDDSELGQTVLVQHSIDVGDSRPIKQPPRRTPLAYRKKVITMITDMLARGIVIPSKSSWASPIVMVTKKDSTLRLCVDYRRLNSITRKDVYPLPRVDDILDSIGK